MISGRFVVCGCLAQDNRNQVHHRGISQYLEDQGHSVEMVGKAGSHNTTQLNLMKSYIDLDYDLYIWLWTDCLREYDWYREHQQGIHNIYDIHRNTELYVQSNITHTDRTYGIAW